MNAAPLAQSWQWLLPCFSLQVHNVEALVSYKADEDDMM